MSMPSIQRMAQISIGILLVIVIRSTAEILRLHHILGDQLTAAQVGPYLVGALVAAITALAVAVLHFTGRDRTSIVVTVSAIAGLMIYKVAALG